MKQQWLLCNILCTNGSTALVDARAGGILSVTSPVSAVTARNTVPEYRRAGGEAAYHRRGSELGGSDSASSRQTASVFRTGLSL